PQLSPLASQLASINIPLVVDGAHVPGHMTPLPKEFPIWVGSGHKWLGGPNGTAFLYCHPDWQQSLKPLFLSDRYYSTEVTHPLRRLEFPGTSDVARLVGLAAAIAVNEKLGQENIAARHLEHAAYARR